VLVNLWFLLKQVLWTEKWLVCKHTDSTLSLAVMQRPFKWAPWWKPLTLCLGTKWLDLMNLSAYKWIWWPLESWYYGTELKSLLSNWVCLSMESWSLKTFNFFSSSYPHWCCFGSCALSVCWQCVLVFKSVARYVFAFDFLLDSSLCSCVMVLWRVWRHVCKFLCINLWFQYPC
jgi:hypothetical protein